MKLHLELGAGEGTKMAEDIRRLLRDAVAEFVLQRSDKALGERLALAERVFGTVCTMTWDPPRYGSGADAVGTYPAVKDPGEGSDDQ